MLLLTVVITATANEGIDATNLPIAIERYTAEYDVMTGVAAPGGEGYRIVHRDYDVELEDRIVKVPILAIQDKGLHHASIEARAKCIAERLVYALDLMKAGGELIVMKDDWNPWRLERGPSKEVYAVYVRHSSLPTAPLRIITLYSQDVERFPFVGTSEEMADYIKAIIEAHYTLFWKRSSDITEYEKLVVDHKTREGKIFKEIFIRALERATLMNRDVIGIKDLTDALSRVAMSQRQRLVRMAATAPRDWPGDPQQ